MPMNGFISKSAGDELTFLNALLRNVITLGLLIETQNVLWAKLHLSDIPLKKSFKTMSSVLTGSFGQWLWLSW